MRITLRWLEKFLPGIRDREGLGATLTDIGLEVEEESAGGPALAGILAGRISARRRIPGTRLSSCTVDVGGGRDVQVVCAAPNARRGVRAPIALPGTALPGGGVIESREVAGVLSEGMLCSEAELGLGDDGSQLLELGRSARSGQRLADLIEADDEVLELSVTPNRGDCLSMLGVARELAAKLELRLKRPREPRMSARLERFPAAIDEAAIGDCPKFTCMPLAGVNAGVPTPPLVRERLRRCGVRPISIIVDITNYVMLELGQPLHAFDRDRLDGGITVRFAREGEELRLLDETEAKLGGHLLAVCDDSGPVALAGVMGGLDSGVTAGTANVLLEGAHFVPSIVRGRTRELNISSEAAFRFERGVDPTMCETAVRTAAKMILRHCGGTAGPLTVAGATPAAPEPVPLPDGKVAKLTGVDIPAAESRRRLRRLGFAAARQGKGLAVTAPPWRFDIERAEDLVEEVVRLGGYADLPATLPRLTGTFVPAPERQLDAASARDRLVADGFAEIVTYAFVPPEWERDFYANGSPIELSNPLSPGQSVMRSGLIGGLVDRAIHNAHRRQSGARMFEIGRCFPGSGEQPVRLAALVWGERSGDFAMPADRGHDFHDLAGSVRRLLPGAEVSFRALSDHPALHPGRAAAVEAGGGQVGIIGELHPRLAGAKRYGIRPAPAVCELDFEALARLAHGRRARRISRLPLVIRDLALLVDSRVPAAQLIECAVGEGTAEHIVEVSVFDSYSGGSLPAGTRSIGLRITLQGSDRNLVESEISAAIDAIAGRLRAGCGAELRA